MTIFQWVSNTQNFLLRMADDGAFDIHSDLVARVRAEGLDYRLIVLAGSARLKNPKRGRARAKLMRAKLETLPVCHKTIDDLYLEALHADGAPRIWLTRAYLRFRGYLLWQWRYGKVVRKDEKKGSSNGG